MNPVDHAEWRGGLIEIIHEKNQDDNFFVDAVRAGIMWPAAESPGYICILGQRPKFNEIPLARKKPLVLIAEHQCHLPQQMIEAIAKETQRLFCRSFFMDCNDRTLTFQEDVDRYLKKFRFWKVDFDEPYLRDWINGVLAIDQWGTDQALEIPEGSILREQILNHTFEDRAESRRGPFYAMDALRCVLGSFEKPAFQPVRVNQGGWAYA